MLKKATGPDKIPVILFKNINSKLFPILAKLLLIEGEILPKIVKSVKRNPGFQERGCAIIPLPLKTHQFPQ